MAEKSEQGEGMDKLNSKPDDASDDYDLPTQPRDLSPAYLDKVMPDHVRAIKAPAE